jgi:hypothetical protein
MGAAPQDEGAQEGAAGQERDEQQQGVHPRLVGVQADEGIERHQTPATMPAHAPKGATAHHAAGDALRWQARRQRVRRTGGEPKSAIAHVQEAEVVSSGGEPSWRRTPGIAAEVGCEGDPSVTRCPRRSSRAPRARAGAAPRPRRRARDRCGNEEPPSGRARARARSQNAGEALAATTVMRLSFPIAPGRIRPRSDPCVRGHFGTDLPRF